MAPCNSKNEIIGIVSCKSERKDVYGVWNYNNALTSGFTGSCDQEVEYFIIKTESGNLYKWNVMTGGSIR